MASIGPDVIGAPSSATVHGIQWIFGSGDRIPLGVAGSSTLFADQTTPYYLAGLVLRTGSSSLWQLWLVPSQTGGVTVAGPDLTEAAEQNETLITVILAGISYVFTGPDHSSALIKDDMEPYVWRPRAADRSRVSALFTAYMSASQAERNAISLTLRDVTPAVTASWNAVTADVSGTALPTGTDVDYPVEDTAGLSQTEEVEGEHEYEYADGLTPGSLYTFRVKAKASGYQDSAQASKTITIPEGVANEAPVFADATHGEMPAMALTEDVQIVLSATDESVSTLVFTLVTTERKRAGTSLFVAETGASITGNVLTVPTSSASPATADGDVWRFGIDCTDNGGLVDDAIITLNVTATTVANVAPVWSDIPDQTVQMGGSAITVDLSDYVTDSDGTIATYTATETDADISISRTGAVVTVMAVSIGSATVRVTATDDDGDSTASSFDVTVTPPDAVAPTLAVSASDVDEGGTSQVLVTPSGGSYDTISLAYSVLGQVFAIGDTADETAGIRELQWWNPANGTGNIGTIPAALAAGDSDLFLAWLQIRLDGQRRFIVGTRASATGQAYGQDVGQELSDAVLANPSAFTIAAGSLLATIPGPDSGHADLATPLDSDEPYFIRLNAGSATLLTLQTFETGWSSLTQDEKDATTFTISDVLLIGSISNAGLYTAPADVTANTTVTISVRATASGTGTNAKSGTSATVTQTTTLTVRNVVANRAPVWSAIPQVSLLPGASATVDLATYASDPDNDSLTYSLVSGGGSSGANAISVTLSGSVLTVSVGADVAAGTGLFYTVRVSDGFLTADRSGAIHVLQPNRAPVWADIPRQTFPSGESVTVNLADYASDPDGDAITYSIRGSAEDEGISWTISGSVLTITADNTRRDDFVNARPRVRASDGPLSTDYFLNVRARDNEPPFFFFVGRINRSFLSTASAGDTLELNVYSIVSDDFDDDDELRYRITITGDTSSFSVTFDEPTISIELLDGATPGDEISVRIRAEDTGGEWEARNYAIAWNQAPIWTAGPIAPAYNLLPDRQQSIPLSDFISHFSDSDGDNLEIESATTTDPDLTVLSVGLNSISVRTGAEGTSAILAITMTDGAESVGGLLLLQFNFNPN